MEGSIEARDLRDMRRHVQDRLHRLKIMRLMQRRQGNELCQLIENLPVQANGSPVLRASVHDTVSDPEDWRSFCQARSNCQYFPRSCRMIEPFRRPATLFNGVPLCISDVQLWGDTNSLYLAAEQNIGIAASITQ